MANKIKTDSEPRWLFNAQGPSGASPGIGGAVKFTPEGIANGAGWKSDVLDLGPGVRNNLFRWQAQTRTSGLATLGGTLELYLATSDDNVIWDGNVGSGNGSVTSLDKRRNLQYLGAIQADVAASGTPFVGGSLANIFSRYVSVVAFNLLGATLSATQLDTQVLLTPTPDEIQNPT